MASLLDGMTKKQKLKMLTIDVESRNLKKKPKKEDKNKKESKPLNAA